MELTCPIHLEVKCLSILLLYGRLLQNMKHNNSSLLSDSFCASGPGHILADIRWVSSERSVGEDPLPRYSLVDRILFLELLNLNSLLVFGWRPL